MRKCLFIFSLLLSLASFGQVTIKGKVIDSKSKKGIPFANLVDSGNRYGTSTDIDGSFTINLPESVKQLWVSNVAYEKKQVSFSGKSLVIELAPLAVDLQELVVLPGVNPAHRIIEKASENKWKNNPKKQTDFEVQSYSKLIATAYIEDSASVFKEGWREMEDTNAVQALEFLEKQNIFLTETASMLAFRRPSSIKEDVVATRMSGFNNPIFTLVSSQMQSFSFYEDKIQVLDNSFLNPLSKGSTKQYLFILQDSIPQGKDTIFVIQFKPRKGKNFKGLEGVLHIHSDGYGIESVQARPFDKIDDIKAEIRQRYEKRGSYWFPSQLNTRLVLETAIIEDWPVLLDGKTYFSAPNTDPNLSSKDFRALSVENIAKDAGKKGKKEMENYRVIPLTSKDSLTYHTMDSIGDAEKLDQKVGLLLTLAKGSVPWGKVQFPIQHWVRYNNVEGFRLGLGLETSEKISKRIALGAYGAYGFKDKRWKYGAYLKFPTPITEKWSWSMGYKHDILEPGLSNLGSIKSNPLYGDLRLFTIRYLELYNTYSVNGTWDVSKSLKVMPKAEYVEQVHTSFDQNTAFSEYRAEVEIDFWPGRSYNKFMDVLIPVGSAKPRITSKFAVGSVTGLTNWTRVGWEYGFPRLGKSSHELIGFFSMDGIENAYGLGTFKASNSGSTLRFSGSNQFEVQFPQLPLHEMQFSYFFSHNFKDLLLSTEKWKPELRVRYGLGVGFEDRTASDYNLIQELGLEVFKLVKVGGTQLGAGVYTELKQDGSLGSPVVKICFSPPF